MSRRVVALGATLAAGFLGEFAFALLLLPLIQRFLVFDRHLSAALPGYILSAYGLTRLVAQIPLGGLANAIDRRLAVTAGYLAVLAAGLTLWAPLPSAALLLASAVFGLGHALADPLVPAALAEGTTSEERGRIMAMFNLAQVTGLVTGLAGGAFIADLAPPAAGFLVVAAANGLTLGLLTLGAAPLLRQNPRLESGRRQTASMWAALRDERVAYLLVVLFVLALTANLLLPDLNLFAVERLHTSMHLMTLYLIPAGVIGVAALPLGGWLADRYGRLPPLIGGSAMGALALGLLTHIQAPWQAALAAVFGAGGLAITMPASNAAMLDVADPAHRALLLSGMMAAQGLAETVGPLLSGIFIRFGGAAFPFGAAAVALWLAGPSSVLFASAPHDDQPGRVVPYTPFTRLLSRAHIRAHTWYADRHTRLAAIASDEDRYRP